MYVHQRQQLHGIGSSLKRIGRSIAKPFETLAQKVIPDQLRDPLLLLNPQLALAKGSIDAVQAPVQREIEAAQAATAALQAEEQALVLDQEELLRREREMTATLLRQTAPGLPAAAARYSTPPAAGGATASASARTWALPAGVAVAAALAVALYRHRSRA